MFEYVKHLFVAMGKTVNFVVSIKKSRAIAGDKLAAQSFIYLSLLSVTTKSKRAKFLKCCFNNIPQHCFE